MRIPTLSQFQQPLATMLKQSADMQQTQLQLATGLRILKPSDDPTGSVKVLNLNTNIGMVEQFSRNTAVAQATLGQQESVLGTIDDTLQRIRELSLQGMNPTNHDSARAGIALEIEERFKELLTLANTRDANGEYLFSGAQANEVPFVNAGGTVSYTGDQTQRSLVVGDGATVTTRDTGDAIFMRIPSGDGKVQVAAGTGNQGTLLVGQYSTNTNYNGSTYTVTFNAASGATPATYSVSDGSATVATGNYTPGEALTFGGASIALSGAPATGDTVVLQSAQNKSLFSLVQDIAAALRVPTGDNSNRAGVQNRMAQGLANLDQAMNVINNQRAAVGARLNNLDSVDTMNEDFKVQLETLKSETQDLDFAEAISRFNQQIASLQAAQQAFAKTSELSLFRYI